MATLLRRALAGFLSLSLAFGANAPVFAAAPADAPADLIAATSALLEQATAAQAPVKKLAGLRAAAQAGEAAKEPTRAEAARIILELIASPERIQAERATLDQRLGAANVSKLEDLITKLRADARPGSALSKALAGLEADFASGLDAGELTANLDQLYTGDARVKDAVGNLTVGAASGKAKAGKVPSKKAVAKAKAPKVVPPGPRPEPPKAPGGWKRFFTHSAWSTALAAVTIGIAVAAATVLVPWAPVDPGWLIAAGIAAGVGSGAASFYGLSALQARRANNLWKKSPQAADLARVERGVEAGDAASLAQLGDGAQQRYRETLRLIQEAEARGEDRIANGSRDSVDKAKTYALFDLLVVARARLGENAVSQDATRRVGEVTPAEWHGRLASAETDAIQTRFEGPLALTLETLRSELGHEEAAAREFESDMKRFRDEVPPVFSGTIGKQADAAERDLKAFRDNEVDNEGSLYSQKNRAMRGRVSDRLYSESREFRDHLDRFHRLSATLSNSAGPAASLARAVEDHLTRAIDHRERESWNLVMAERNRAVRVRRTRTVRDSNGNTRTETYTQIEDQSWSYRSAAASEASAARNQTESANSALRELRPTIGRLHDDRTIQDEGLSHWLPTHTPGWINEGGGGYDSWFLPPLWQQFRSMDSRAEIERARGEFRHVLDSLVRVEGELSSRQSSESNWVGSRITEDLGRQMDRARGKKD